MCVKLFYLFTAVWDFACSQTGWFVMNSSLLTGHCLEKYFHINLFNSRYCHFAHFVLLVLKSFLLPELQHNVTYMKVHTCSYLTILFVVMMMMMVIDD